MNPGPFGMAQNGIPFGDTAMVRDWIGIKAPVGRPDPEHPRRPIQGFAIARGEVSGARLWGWARDRFGTPERFFRRAFVWNYCPLAFMGESGRNITPRQAPSRRARPPVRGLRRGARGRDRPPRAGDGGRHRRVRGPSRGTARRDGRNRVRNRSASESREPGGQPRVAGDLRDRAPRPRHRPRPRPADGVSRPLGRNRPPVHRGEAASHVCSLRSGCYRRADVAGRSGPGWAGSGPVRTRVIPIRATNGGGA